MRWIRYTADGRTAYGILDGDTITEVKGDPFDGFEPTVTRRALSSVAIELPVEARTFYCVGLNYAEHVVMAAQKLGIKAELPEKPDVGYRANNALIPHGADVVIPRDATEKVHYEGELAVIIGKRVPRHTSEADALNYVLGYTIGNDVSERTWQKGDRTLWRAKNSDTFKPMGPWIETDFDIGKAETRIRVNGTETTRFKTGAMIHGVALYISTISRYSTLEPRDILWMGTDDKSPDLKHGDVVEVEITGIGTLRNRFVREGMPR